MLLIFHRTIENKLKNIPVKLKDLAQRSHATTENQEKIGPKLNKIYLHLLLEKSLIEVLSDCFWSQMAVHRASS